MFNSKQYFEVNREEKFYCFLYAHSLLTSKNIREKFCELINNKYNYHLNPEKFEIFIEVAALRDYWNDLGDPKKYSKETHQRRMKILIELLHFINLSDSIIHKFDFFWTTKNHKKLWIPGHWSVKGIEQSGKKELLKIKWAFNAKPDILIISESKCLFIEAKIESGLGQYGEGNNQLDTQILISQLLKLLVPSFSEKEFKNIMLTKEEYNGISWKEIVGTLDEKQIDAFTYKCFYNLMSNFNDN